MRTLRLARIAAEAEGLRLRRMAQRTAIRLAIGLIALFFLFCAFAIFHVGVWFWLRDAVGLGTADHRSGDGRLRFRHRAGAAR